MSILNKFTLVAAAVAVTATSAVALESVEVAIPDSLANSGLTDGVDVETIQLFVEDVAAPSSVDETLSDYTDDITTTIVPSVEDTGVPGSLANTRLYQR